MLHKTISLSALMMLCLSLNASAASLISPTGCRIGLIRLANLCVPASVCLRQGSIVDGQCVTREIPLPDKTLAQPAAIESPSGAKSHLLNEGASYPDINSRAIPRNFRGGTGAPR